MKNRDLAAMFARGSTSGQGSNMFIEGNTIYSYGKHFPVARRTPTGYLLQKRGYSKTTAVHKGYVRRAIGSYQEMDL